MVEDGLRITKKKRISVGDFRIGKAERNALEKVIVSNRISEGPRTRQFEREWARFIGAKYCVATSSGAGALITALTALKYYRNLKGRAKAITSPLTYIADASALSLTGFEPVFVDIDPLNLCVTPDLIRAHLEKSPDKEKYGIIMPVDLMGYPVEIDKIKKIAKEYRLLVLEDAAQAHGSVYADRKAGSAADLGVFSFYIAHNIQAGEMGAITTDDYEIYRLSKKIKAQGRVCECPVCTRSKGVCSYQNGRKKDDDSDPRFLHDLIGYNFKTMEFQAALALVQLQKMVWIIQKRRQNVLCLNKALEPFSNLLQLPLYSEKVSYLAYPLVIRNPAAVSRQALRCALEKRGIETRPLFGCIPTHQPAYAHLKKRYAGKLPNAEYAGLNGFYIGCHQYLSKPDLDYIVLCFKDILGKING